MSTEAGAASEDTGTTSPEATAGTGDDTAGASDVPVSEDEGAEGAAEGGEQPEGAEKPAAAKAPTAAELFAKLPEAEQEALGRKFANGTMAAARRAEARVEAVKTENTTLKTENTTFRGFVEQLRAGDPIALQRVGFKNVREFIDAMAAFGSDKPAPTADDRVSELEKRIKDRDDADAKAKAEAAIETSKKAVFEGLAKDERFDLVVNTARGRADLWGEVEAYFKLHGDCPDAAVFMLAEKVEAAHAADLGTSKKFGQRQPANKGAVPGKAAPETLNPGTTLTAKASSSAPVVSEYPEDDGARRKQIAEELRREGLI